MLKVKDNVDLKQLEDKYELHYEFYEYDEDYSNDGDMILEKRDCGVFIDIKRREIFGIDNSKLDLLYDLIKADLIEKESE